MRPPTEPRVLTRPLTPARSGVALGASLVVHLLVMVGAVILGRSTATSPATAPEPPGRTIDMITLPPLPPPPRVAEPERRRREVPRPQVTTGKPLPEEAYFRPESPPLELAIAPPPAATAPDPVSEPLPRETAAPAASSATIESEAQRLFGPRRSGAGASAGPIAATSWINALTEDRNNDCVPRARPAPAPGTPVDLGVVTGVVYREGSREPLGGAFLQILGTPYSTFADSRGAYALNFDKSLVDDCRTQYVQVSKDGFAPRRLILSLGARVSNDIPLSRR